MFARNVQNVLEGGSNWTICPPPIDSTCAEMDTTIKATAVVAAGCAKAEVALRFLIDELKERISLRTDALLALEKSHSDYISKIYELEAKKIQMYEQNHHLLATRRMLLKKQEFQNIQYIYRLQEMSMESFKGPTRSRDVAMYEFKRRRDIESRQYELQVRTAMLKRLEEENRTIYAENEALLQTLIARSLENEPGLTPEMWNQICIALNGGPPGMSEENLQKEGDKDAEGWWWDLQRKEEALRDSGKQLDKPEPTGGQDPEKSNDKVEDTATLGEKLAATNLGTEEAPSPKESNDKGKGVARFSEQSTPGEWDLV
ncbi:hypothetical protein EKO27_g5878 [Xylaria grammica]|uniref:Uncharacterized protein n=1 Tax=Xylaria grammica TaxID=363999 RepID=A0A439D482_9PEZI|nr:hypothetical protein EKO27_g5878 [Xylaria grammica]